MKERGILFSAPMIRALLDGSKTQTRRVAVFPEGTTQFVFNPERDGKWWPVSDDDYTGTGVRCPFGAIGDTLWVRESWQHYDWTEEGEPYVRYAADNSVRFCEGAGEGETLVDVWAELSEPSNYAIDNRAADRKWRPSIFMPRWASRITLEITDVRVERLQEISEADAIAEGIERTGGDRYWLGHDTHDVKGTRKVYGTAVRAYESLWNSLNAKRAPWSSNPWVWALTFARISPPAATGET